MQHYWITNYYNYKWIELVIIPYTLQVTNQFFTTWQHINKLNNHNTELWIITNASEKDSYGGEITSYRCSGWFFKQSMKASGASLPTHTWWMAVKSGNLRITIWTQYVIWFTHTICTTQWNTLIEHGFTSATTQYRLYGPRFFTGLMTQPTVSKHWRRVVSHPDRPRSNQAHLTVLQ